MEDFYVYCWTNRLNGRQYIGKGRGKRAQDHMRFAFHAKRGCTVFYRAVRKYGVEAFGLTFLAAGLCEDLAFSLECTAIEVYGSQREGYNCTSGGEGVSGMPRTPEHNAKIAAANTGHVHTAKHRRRISEAKSNPSDETRARMRAAKWARPQAEDTKARRSAALKGKPWSPARRAVHKPPATKTPRDVVTLIHILLSLGAVGKDVAGWLGVSATTVSNLKRAGAPAQI